RDASVNQILIFCQVGFVARIRNKGFSAFITNAIPDLNLAPGMGGYQCFPLYLYDNLEDQTKADKAAPGLFDMPTQPCASTRRPSPMKV
ncbi:type ISP restriction/modification enzyme, partial [Pseudomonas syringae]